MKKAEEIAKPEISNYFVSIPRWLKSALIFYFLLFGVFENIFAISVDPDLTFLKFVIAFLRIIKTGLLLLPVLFSFRGVGILHPLLFPFLLQVLRNIFQSPIFLISPFFTTGVELNYSNVMLSVPSDLEALNVMKELVVIIWLSFIYIGYFLFKPKGFKLKPLLIIPSNSRFRYMAILGILIVGGFLYFQGGLTEWIKVWGAGGRRQALEDIGPIVRLVAILFVIPLSWLIMKGKKVLQYPLFITVAVLFTFNGYIASGSRSAVLDVIITFLAAWMLIKNKIPGRLIMFSGITFFFLFGLLGEIRKASTFTGGKFSWSNIEFNLGSMSDAASKEIELRNNLQPDVVIYEKVPGQVDYIYGKPYLAAVFFWLPRFIWPDKPHGVGYYTGREILKVGTGVPPSPQAEAYWNFSFFGVILIAIINGCALRFLSKMHYKNRFHRGWIVIYVIIITSSLSFSSLDLTELFQRLIFTIPILKFLKML